MTAKILSKFMKISLPRYTRTDAGIVYFASMMAFFGGIEIWFRSDKSDLLIGIAMIVGSVIAIAITILSRLPVFKKAPPNKINSKKK